MPREMTEAVYGGITIQAHRRTVRDEQITRRQLVVKLADVAQGEPFMDTEAWLFTGLVCCTDAVSGIKDWRLPLPTDKPEEVQGLFFAYLDFDDGLREVWKQTVDQANAPLTDPKLVPAEQLSDSEKKESPPKEASTESK